MPGQQNPNFNNMDFRGEEESWDIVYWLNLLYEHRWWIIGLTVFTVFLAVLYSYLATPIYSATATVYIKSYAQQPIQGYNPSGVTSWSEEEKFYNSQAQIIKSQPIMEEAASKLHIAENPKFSKIEEPWKFLSGFVDVKQQRDSALFEITVSAPYKEYVADWANTIADVYRDKTLHDSLGFIDRANKAILEEAKKMQDQYIKQQSLYASNLQAQGSYLPKNQKEILDKKIEALELKSNDVAVKESEVRAIVSQLQSGSLTSSGNPTSIPTSSANDAMTDVINEYNNMVRDLAKLEVKFTPQHPDVIALRGRIAKQRSIILNAYTSQLSALRREKGNLQTELNALKKQGLQFVEGSSTVEALETTATSIKKYMDLLYDKTKELNISAALLNSNIRVVNPAMPPKAPISPRKRLNLLLGLMLGLLFSAGSVIAYQFIDTSIKSVEDIETQLGRSLLSMVPDMQKENASAAEEAFQTLRIALVFASENKKRNMLLFTSAAPQEGKTTVTVNLAKAVAETGERVLLVDCDLRRPSVPRQLNLHVKNGLTNYLAKPSEGIENYIVRGPHPNLFVLPSGPIPPNPPELFAMKRFRQLFEELKQGYDWVFIDSPPFLSISDAQVLAGMCDMTVFITRFKKTKRPMVERSLLMLERLGVSVAGIVLNGISTSSSSYYDYYYYNHYYYEKGKEPKRLPWMIGKVGGWKDIFRSSKR